MFKQWTRFCTILLIVMVTLEWESYVADHEWFGQARRDKDNHAWFVLVTNLSPCVGLRVHLWPEKGQSGDVAASERLVEVTMKMVQLPAGPTPPQVRVFFL